MLYPRFGGYHGYMAAPLIKTQQHRIEFIAFKEVEAEQAKEQQAEIESQRRAAERGGR